MADASHYVIRGGVEGRERLRTLGRVMQPTTAALLDRLGLRDGQVCLDVGCGGGDATLEIARRVAPAGHVVGVDIDDTKLALARAEAEQLGVRNVEFRNVDVRQSSDLPVCDVVYARFLLTHLNDPAAAVEAFRRHVRAGGIIAVEDIDFSGYFADPYTVEHQRFRDWYCATVIKRGGDPNIGPRLPGLLKRAGVRDVRVNVVQPAAMEGEPKLISPLTLDAIAAPVLEDGLATRDEIDATVAALSAFAADPGTVAGMPRVVQAWGHA
jgi:SAM-dependent methyltransferase